MLRELRRGSVAYNFLVHTLFDAEFRGVVPATAPYVRAKPRS